MGIERFGQIDASEALTPSHVEDSSNPYHEVVDAFKRKGQRRGEIPR